METVFELHGTVSGNCLRASVAFEEAGIAYRVVQVDTQRGENRGEGFLGLNPAGRVPVLVERSSRTSRALAQSNAIVLYVAEMKPGALLPVDDARARAITYERYFHFVTDVIAVSHAAYHLEKFGKPAEAVRYLEQDALDTLLATERFVAAHAYMAGPRFTIADIAAYTIAHHLREAIDWDRVPNLERWFHSVESRPATKRGMRAFDRQIVPREQETPCFS